MYMIHALNFMYMPAWQCIIVVIVLYTSLFCMRLTSCNAMHRPIAVASEFEPPVTPSKQAESSYRDAQRQMHEI